MANRLERKGTYKPEEVLNFVPNPKDYPPGMNMKKILRDYDGDMIKMGSLRYYTFIESLQCAHCDRVGVLMGKERHLNKKGVPMSEHYHFNLYAVDPDGTEVLMTKDHVIPKSKGGKDVIGNFVTMCEPCNLYKRNKDEKNAKKLADERKANGQRLTLKEAQIAVSKEVKEKNKEKNKQAA